jgi:sulfotransferase family protein
MRASPIFIIGTERSGSNLLRLILNAHSRIAVPHPPHLVRYFAPLMRSYGDLRSDRAFSHFTRDVVRLLETHIHPWEVTIDVEGLRRTARRDLLGVYVAIYQQYRDALGKARWGCKSTFMIDWVRPLLDRLPDAQFLFLVRDPRDVAASSRQAVFSTFHPHRTALLWQEQQEKGLELLQALPAETIHRLRYEDLVREPERAVRSLCAFLEEGFEPAMLRHFAGEEARRTAALAEAWANTAQPVNVASVGRFDKDMTPREVRLVERVTAASMVRLGYAPTCSAPELAAAAPGTVERLYIGVVEVVLWLRVEVRSLCRDRNVGRRWRRALFLARLRLGALLWSFRQSLSPAGPAGPAELPRSGAHP